MHDQENPYNYFVGKPVTVVTIASNLSSTPSNHLNYSVGVLKSVDEWTCLLQHPITACHSIFRLEHIIAIHEEQQIDPESEEGKRILEEQEAKREAIKNNNPNLFQEQKSTSPMPRVERPTPVPIPAAKVKEQTVGFVSADDLEQLASAAAAKKKRPS